MFILEGSIEEKLVNLLKNSISLNKKLSKKQLEKFINRCLLMNAQGKEAMVEELEKEAVDFEMQKQKIIKENEEKVEKYGKYIKKRVNKERKKVFSYIEKKEKQKLENSIDDDIENIFK